jgi:hypothetical protein
VVRLLNSERGRVAFLNAMLLLAFAAAWVSDQWPQFAIPAIAFAGLVVFGAALLLYVAAKHARACKEPPPKNPEHQSVQHETSHATPASATVERKSLWSVEVLANLYAHGRAYDDEAFISFLAHRPSDIRAAYVALSQSWPLKHGLPSTPDELSKWRLIRHAPDSFNIRAGSFEIEHFHGHTNIRVLDPSRVTVEGEERGVRPKSAPPGIKAPVYQ